MKSQSAPLPANELALSTKAIGMKGEIIACHNETLKAGNEMVQAAYRCGELLEQVKAVLKASKSTSFEKFVEQFLPFSDRSARSYVRLYNDLRELPNRKRASVLESADSINEARRLISVLAPDPPAAKSSPPPVPPAEPADDPLYFPTEDGPDVNEDADPVEADEIQPPAPQASVVLDLFDRPIPSQHKAAHELAALIASQARRLDPILRELLALADQQGGEFIPRAPLEIAIKAIKGQILGACYAFECPRCEGLIGKTCKSCGGKGYWPMEKKGKLSAADKTYLGID